jgi:hypothetical protein
MTAKVFGSISTKIKGIKPKFCEKYRKVSFNFYVSHSSCSKKPSKIIPSKSFCTPAFLDKHRDSHITFHIWSYRALTWYSFSPKRRPENTSPCKKIKRVIDFSSEISFFGCSRSRVQTKFVCCVSKAKYFIFALFAFSFFLRRVEKELSERYET